MRVGTVDALGATSRLNVLKAILDLVVASTISTLASLTLILGLATALTPTTLSRVILALSPGIGIRCLS